MKETSFSALSALSLKNKLNVLQFLSIQPNTQTRDVPLISTNSQVSIPLAMWNPLFSPTYNLLFGADPLTGTAPLVSADPLTGTAQLVSADPLIGTAPPVGAASVSSVSTEPPTGTATQPKRKSYQEMLDDTLLKEHGHKQRKQNNGKRAGVSKYCDDCNLHYIDLESHKLTEKHIAVKESRSDVNTTQCPICRQYVNDLKQHITDLHRRSKTCDICGLMFSSKLSVQRHTAVYHSGLFLCSYCHTPFGSESDKQKHYDVCHILEPKTHKVSSIQD